VLLKSSCSTASTEAKVGDIVLIKENLPRGRWKVGKICELIQSKDKMIQSAKVTVGQHKSIKRPLSLLYPIECPKENISHSSNISEENQAKDNESCNEETIGYRDYDDMLNDDTDSPKDDMQQTVHPTHKAVIKTRQRIQQWLSPNEESSLGSVAAHVMQ